MLLRQASTLSLFTCCPSIGNHKTKAPLPTYSTMAREFRLSISMACSRAEQSHYYWPMSSDHGAAALSAPAASHTAVRARKRGWDVRLLVPNPGNFSCRGPVNLSEVACLSLVTASKFVGSLEMCKAHGKSARRYCICVEKFGITCTPYSVQAPVSNGVF